MCQIYKRIAAIRSRNMPQSMRQVYFEIALNQLKKDYPDPVLFERFMRNHFVNTKANYPGLLPDNYTFEQFLNDYGKH